MAAAAAAEQGDDRETYRVALVVFCEAKGVDESDASAAGRIALNRLIREHREPGAQHHVGSSEPPVCSRCGVDAPLTPAGLLDSHVAGERYSPDGVFRDNGGAHRPAECGGSGHPPRQPDEPVIGFTRPDGLDVYARVHDVMEVGMALGNGYLWTRPTRRAFR